jgi:hypothetical protein
MQILASASVINSIAVADVHFILGAESPNGVLHEPRKECREAHIVSARVDPSGKSLDDIRAAAPRITGPSIPMLRTSTTEDARAMQKIMHQTVDHDHCGPGIDPLFAISIRTHQHITQGHRHDFVANPVNIR